jgi:hypothetical protein
VDRGSRLDVLANCEIYPVLALGGKLTTSVLCIEIEHKMYLCYPGAEVSVTPSSAGFEASVGGLQASVFCV